MPAHDKYHAVVARALEKDGWVIEAEQVRLRVGQRRFWIDLQARKPSGEAAILVEIKGFENTPSPIDYFYSVVGQYLVYRVILNEKGPKIDLYLAVPTQASQQLLSEEIGQLVLQELHIKVLIFDPEREEVVQWID